MKSRTKHGLVKRVNNQSSFTTTCKPSDTGTSYQLLHRTIWQHLSSRAASGSERYRTGVGCGSFRNNTRCLTVYRPLSERHVPSQAPTVRRACADGSYQESGQHRLSSAELADPTQDRIGRPGPERKP